MKKLPEFCARHPVFASVLSILLITLGLVSMSRLEIRYFPDFQQSIAYINTTLKDASAEFMSNEVTRILENSISGIDGIKETSSSSSDGNSQITVKFDDNINYYAAVNKIRNAIAGVQEKLPKGMETPPSVSDNSGANWNSVPTLNLAFSSTSLSMAELGRYLRQVVIPQLSDVEGVGGVPGPYGVSSPALRVWLDPKKMARLNIGASDIIDGLKNHNITISSGSIQGPDRNFTVVSNSPLRSPEDFARIILKIDNNQPIRLRDLATVGWGETALYPSPLYVNGKQGLALEIRPFTSANPVSVAAHVLKRLERIKKQLPPTITAEATYNQTIFIKLSINECFKAIFEAIVLVSFVVFLFLGSIRLSIIPIITIPVCIIGVFAVMLAFGFTINIMSLLALVLAIGLVVDDAIVIVENCHRHVESGLTPLQAAIRGSQELTFAIIAMTLTLAIVYIPIGLSHGFTATIFREFAFTLAGAVLISGFIALTLSPMMCARLLKPIKHEHKNRLIAAMDRLLERLSYRYQSALTRVVKRPKSILVMILVLLSLAGCIYYSLGQELIPKEDIGYLQTGITLIPNASQNYINENMAHLDKILTKNPDIAKTMSFYISSPTNFLTLKPWDKRRLHVDQLITSLTDKVNQEVPAISFAIQKPDPVDFGVGTTSFNLKLMTLKQNSTLLKETSDRVVKALKKYPGLTAVTSSLVYNQQQFEFKLNQNMADILGVDLKQISDSLSVLLGGNHATDINTPDGTQYPVNIQLAKNYLKDFSVLQSIYVPSRKSSATAASKQNLVPLSQLVTLSPITGQARIETFNKKRAATISGTIRPHYTASQVANEVSALVKPLLQSEQSMSFSGLIKQVADSQQSSILLMVLALIFIYLILAAQFESFLDPLVIMLTVPLSVAGALISLYLTHNTLNIYTNIGILTLIGLVTKHGILIVQFANQLIRDGRSIQEAVLESARIRLRPILMTTSAMVFGALPLALATGPGAIGRTSIGWVLVGGLSLGTVLSLFLVPSAYLFFAHYRDKDILRALFNRHKS